MNRKQVNHRSMLAMAGERSLNNSLNNSVTISKYHKDEIKEGPITGIIPPKIIDRASEEKRIKQIMMKLTLPRLRKMQGLVRGFIVRRRVYPAVLRQFKLASSLLDLIISNTVQKQLSDIILSHPTSIQESKSSPLGLGISGEISDRIVIRVLQGMVKEVVEKAVTEHAKLITRPKITYGFNLRDPLQLLLYDILSEFVEEQHQGIAREAIQECTEETRQLMTIDSWIDSYQMLQPMYEEIVEECLTEDIGEYVVDSIVEDIVGEGSQVIAKICLQQSTAQRQTAAYQQISNRMMEWMIQQASLSAILELGHSITK